MALFPKIESPCPYPGDLDDIVSAGKCALCDKVVHDLTAMTDEARRHLVESHKGDLCVRYTVLRPALAAMALGLSATAAMAVERPPATHRQTGGKAVKAHAKPLPAPPVVPIILAGAPVALPAERDADAAAPRPDTQWIEERPAQPPPRNP